MDLNKLQLLVELKDVPDGSMVFKQKGQAPYTVKRRIIFFAEPGVSQIPPIEAHEGTVFLVHSSGSINAYPDSKRVVWHTGFDQLERIKLDQEEERK